MSTEKKKVCLWYSLIYPSNSFSLPVEIILKQIRLISSICWRLIKNCQYKQKIGAKKIPTKIKKRVFCSISSTSFCIIILAQIYYNPIHFKKILTKIYIFIYPIYIHFSSYQTKAPFIEEQVPKKISVLLLYNKYLPCICLHHKQAPNFTKYGQIYFFQFNEKIISN